jgi:2,5-diketo-D-gluconate reductase A
MRAKADGLTRDIGVSNYPIELIDQLIDATGEVPVVNQIEWSPFGHSDDMLRYAKEKNIVIQAYSPLTRAKRLDEDELEDIAESYGKTPAQIMIRWNLQRGTVPIPKANHIDHLKEDIDVFDFEISQADMATLDRLNEHYSSLGRLAYQ